MMAAVTAVPVAQKVCLFGSNAPILVAANNKINRATSARALAWLFSIRFW